MLNLKQLNHYLISVVLLLAFNRLKYYLCSSMIKLLELVKIIFTSLVCRLCI